MQLRFWGTRGSIARPGRSTLRYGGNTSCVELRPDDGTLIVLDSGTGIHELGRSLRDSGSIGQHGHLLISHTHWDHIQGFPFFAPLFQQGSYWDVYAPGGRAKQLEASLAGQMSYDYHPIGVDALEATVEFHDLVEGLFEIGDVRVATRYLNHPALTLGYRFEADDAVLVYATDHEPHSILPRDAAPGTPPVHHEDQRHVEFLKGADLVIHDAQYTLDSFPQKTGWGHTPVERAVDYAMAAGVPRLALFHHDPENDDEAMDALTERAQKRAKEGAARGLGPLDVFAAMEGMSVELPRQPGRQSQGLSHLSAGASLSASRKPSSESDSAVLARAPHRAATVLIAESDPAAAMLLRTALEAEGVRLLLARDGEAAVDMVRREKPALVLLNLGLPVIDGLEVCRRLRGDGDVHLRDLPIVVITGQRLDERGLLEAFRAGATDYLAKPVKPTLVRSRVRGWLLRTRPEVRSS